MFTGIVEAMGVLVRARDGAHGSARDRELVVEHDAVARELAVGASVALDGVCQTVTQVEAGRFTVHAVAETLRVTTLAQLRVGRRVNLETPLRAGAPLGGHFVQGHVDGTARLADRTPQGESVRFTFTAPPALLTQLVPKGSVAIDGVSLTVGPQLGPDRFEVFLIPHTLAVTTLGERQPGDLVNVETDILGKYVLRLLRGGSGAGLSWEGLRAAGFGTAGTGDAR
jgi:riboflavin synthase alpha subunit